MMDWYKIPKKLNRPVWSEPYFDDCGGNANMVPCEIVNNLINDVITIYFETEQSDDISMLAIQFTGK